MGHGQPSPPQEEAVAHPGRLPQLAHHGSNYANMNAEATAQQAMLEALEEVNAKLLKRMFSLMKHHLPRNVIENAWRLVGPHASATKREERIQQLLRTNAENMAMIQKLETGESVDTPRAATPPQPSPQKNFLRKQ